MSDTSLAVVVLAAGKGTRMRSLTPKVLHEALGRTLLDWVLDSTTQLDPQLTVVVVGHGADEVASSLPAGMRTAVQVNQNGSGDALRAAMPQLEGFEGNVLVVNGDGALFTASTMCVLVETHAAAGAGASALGIESADELPYGRLVMDAEGHLERIVEAVDATPQEREIRILNAGMYCFDSVALRETIGQLSNDNAKGEYYITDLMELVAGTGRPALGVVAGSEEELLGVNTRADLAETAAILQRRIVEQHMVAGVTVLQPEHVLIEPTVRIAPDAVIEPGCVLRGETTIQRGATIGPNTTLVDTEVETDASVLHSYCTGAVIGPGASVGPFAYLRPQAHLEEGAKAGAFVEVKKSVIGPRSKVPHLTYIGDAEIGSDSNIGAGTITANYRPELGKGKQATRIGSNVRTGSDNVFVAPVTIEDGAWTAAGSIITEDVPAGALAIARARQVNIDGYANRTADPSPVT